jgi:hypothetical protein
VANDLSLSSSTSLRAERFRGEACPAGGQFMPRRGGDGGTAGRPSGRDRPGSARRPVSAAAGQRGADCTVQAVPFQTSTSGLAVPVIVALCAPTATQCVLEVQETEVRAL